MISRRSFLRLKNKRILGVFAATFVLVVVSVSGYASHVHSKNIRNAEQAKLLSEQKEKERITAEEQAILEAQNEKDSQENVPADMPESSPTSQTEIKYATSSDPRSTAYSTTPPKANPTDVNIKITRPNQLPAGSLLYNNTTKGEKGYYGGDLIVTPSLLSVVFDASIGNFTTPQKFQVQVPDGATTLPPSFPWDWNFNNAPLSFGTFGFEGPGPGSSFTFDLIPSPSTIKEGTYTLQFHTTRYAQTADSWSYDGFLTVKVTIAATMLP